MPTKAKTTVKPIEVKKAHEPVKKEAIKDTGNKLVKSCSKDGYTINLYKKGQGYCLNTNEDETFIDIDEGVANVIINKGDIYNNLHGVYSK